MNTTPAARMNWLPLPWANYGDGLLEARGTDRRDYQNTIKERLLESIALCHWEAVSEHAKKQGHSVEKIGRQLGVHRTTVERWIRKEHTPHPDKFFGALVVVLKEEIHRVAFPQNRDAVWLAVRRTLGVIREKDCEEPAPRKATLDRNALRVVQHAVRHREGEALIPGQEGRTEDAHRVLGHVLRQMAGRQPHEVPSLAEAINAFDAWVTPYVLFRVGLIRGWEALDELAA